MHYLICTLVALGLHRLWNMEDIFAPVRARLGRRPWLKPITCMSCNAFWIGVAVAAAAWQLHVLTPLGACAFPFAAYPLLRLAAWAYVQPWQQLFVVRPAPAAAAPATPAAPSSPALPAPPAEGCSTCAQKASAMQAERARTDQYAERIIFITQRPLAATFGAAQVLVQQPKVRRLVQIWCPPTSMQEAPAVPGLDVVPWLTPELLAPEATSKLRALMVDRLIWLGNATIITDLLYGRMGASVALRDVIERLGVLPAFKWLHDMGSLDRVEVLSLPATPLTPQHRIAVANDADRERLVAHGVPSRQIVMYSSGLEQMVAAPEAVPMPAAPVAP